MPECLLKRSYAKGMAKTTLLDPMSTTAMLRRVHALSAGDLTAAMRELSAQSHDHPGAAASALRVLRERLTKTPGATHFDVLSCGLVRVAKRDENAPARVSGPLFEASARGQA